MAVRSPILLVGVRASGPDLLDLTVGDMRVRVWFAACIRGRTRRIENAELEQSPVVLLFGIP